MTKNAHDEDDDHDENADHSNPPKTNRIKVVQINKGCFCKITLINNKKKAICTSQSVETDAK